MNREPLQDMMGFGKKESLMQLSKLQRKSENNFPIKKSDFPKKTLIQSPKNFLHARMLTCEQVSGGH
jgi:hypothetical protein